MHTSVREPDAFAVRFAYRREGTRIYHVPGGASYAKTRIDTAKGERWFCGESEARASGWRRAKR